VFTLVGSVLALVIVRQPKSEAATGEDHAAPARAGTRSLHFHH
jgi:hypothetical protein